MIYHSSSDVGEVIQKIRRISRPTERAMTPIFGWNLSQATENIMRKRGMQARTAPMKIANPATPLTNPPTKGM